MFVFSQYSVEFLYKVLHTQNLTIFRRYTQLRSFSLKKLFFFPDAELYRMAKNRFENVISYNLKSVFLFYFVITIMFEKFCV